MKSIADEGEAPISAMPVPFPDDGNQSPRTALATPHPMLLTFRSGRWRWPWAIVTTVTAVALLAVLMFAATFVNLADTAGWSETEVLMRLGVLSDYILVALFSGMLGCAGLAALWLVKGDSPRLALTATGRFHSADLVKAALAIIVVYGAAALLMYTLAPDDFSRPLRTPDFWGWLVLGLGVIFMQASSEEIFFRGVLFRVWGAVIPYAWISAGLIIAVFIALHLSNGDVQRDLWLALMIFALGEALAYYVLLRTKCLAAPIGLHWANNAFQFFIVTTVPPHEIDTAVIVYTDPVYAVQGTRLWDPATHLMNVAGVVLIAVLLFWRRSPLYLPRRELQPDT